MKNLPDAFLERAKQFSGLRYDEFIASLFAKPPVSIRKNPYKPTDSFASEEKITWSQQGYYLKERPSFTFDPLFHGGAYYVQEASSQFLENPFLQAYKTLDQPLKILDLCAAPGGKSSHILSLIGPNDLLVSNEIIPNRNSILRHNLIRWGCPNLIVTQNEPADFRRLESYFDIIVVDAPCSGEGLFRKDENSINEWSPDNVKRCTLRQQEILQHALHALKPGGYLIYSTCTFEPEENDRQVANIVRKGELLPVPIENKASGMVQMEFGIQFYPHLIQGEGFYIALLKKEGEGKSGSANVSSKKKTPVNSALERFLDNFPDYASIEKEARLFAIPMNHFYDFQVVKNNLFVRLAGIHVGDSRGSDFVPAHAISLSLDVSRNIPIVDLNLEDAIEYLQGGLPKISAVKGWNLISHKGLNIGWIKGLGNRNNNYYPKEMRIRKQH